MTKNLLANLAIVIGTTTGSVTIVDWVLTASQKRKVRSWGDHVWLWLDEQRLGKFTDLVINVTAQVGMAIAILVLYLARYVFEMSRRRVLELDGTDLAIVILFLGASVISGILVLREVHPAVTSWLLQDKKPFSFLFRGFKLALISILVLALPNLIISSLIYSDHSDQNIYYVFSFFFCCLVILSPIIIESILIIDSFLLCFFWFLIVILLMVVFRMAQFFLLRIVDYPNGPVLAVSALLGGMAVLVKAFL